MTDNDSNQLEHMINLNQQQSKYYDSPTAHRNRITETWAQIRRRLIRVQNQLGILRDVHELHRKWLGNLAGKSVLDLGCGRGNFLSIEIARQSSEYLAVDLSQKAIEEFRLKLAPHNLPHARAEALDFLASSFTQKFDVIYAYSVLHHFEHFDAFLKKLASNLNPGGFVVSFDPMNTSLAVQIVRGLYRPFESDKDWEWPFERKSFNTIQGRFKIEQIQGVLGWAKWALPLGFVNQSLIMSVGKKLHEKDLRECNTVGSDLYRCMHVAMKLTEKTSP